MAICIATPLKAGGGGGGDRESFGSSGGTVNVGNTPQQGKKLDVVYTQKNLRRIKRKDLETAIKANQLGHSVVVEGFNRRFSTEIFRLLHSDASFDYLGINLTARDRLFGVLSEMERHQTRKSRRLALTQEITDQKAVLKRMEKQLAAQIEMDLALPRYYAAVNEQRDLIDFLKMWRRNPAQGVVH